MGDTFGGQSLGDWLRQYGKERTRRQQGEAVAQLLAERLPDMLVVAADRPLTAAELDEVLTEMLACGERLVLRLTLPPAAEMCAA